MIAIVIELNLFPKFPNWFCILVHGFFPVFLSFDCCCSCSLLKAIAKSKGNLIAITYKSERVITVKRAIKKRSNELVKKKEDFKLNLKGVIEKSQHC